MPEKRTIFILPVLVHVHAVADNLSWVCHSGRLGGAACQYQTCVAARMAAAVASAAAGSPTRLDRARVDGSGLVCPLAVSADRPPGLAPVFAYQYRRDLSARRDAVL